MIDEKFAEGDQQLRREALLQSSQPEDHPELLLSPPELLLLESPPELLVSSPVLQLAPIVLSLVPLDPTQNPSR